MAIQIFYQNDFLNGAANLAEMQQDLIENYALDADKNLESFRAKIDEVFLNNLVSGVALDLKTIDAEISQFLSGDWNLEKLDDVARQILRVCTFELKFLSQIPAKVVIDEYVDIAASFFDQKRTSFFNAIIENLAKKLRPEEFA